jgi:hypothetical protein
VSDPLGDAGASEAVRLELRLRGRPSESIDGLLQLTRQDERLWSGPASYSGDQNGRVRVVRHELPAQPQMRGSDRLKSVLSAAAGRIPVAGQVLKLADLRLTRWSLTLTYGHGEKIIADAYGTAILGLGGTATDWKWEVSDDDLARLVNAPISDRPSEP